MTLARIALLTLCLAAPMPPSLETRYAEAARDAGCPPDQARNFARAGVVLQPRQLAASAAARLCDRPGGPTKVGYGGARGGGKSHWAIAQVVVDDCQRYPGLKALYLRKVGKAGKEAVQDLRREVLHSTPHDYKAGENILRLPNGSKVVLGHFQNEKDIDNYLGLQYDVALIEEATQLAEKKVREIATCVRSAKKGWRPRMYYTTNPGGVGHAWFKELFIKPLRAGKEKGTRFVQATVYDNGFVNPENRAELEALPGWQKKAWLEGDWDCLAGQFFTNFRRDVHALKPDQVAIGEGWRVWLALDYGFTHYTVVYLFAQDGDGVIYAVDEHGEKGWLPERHAEAIGAMLRRNGVEPWRVERFVAGGDVFDRRHDGSRVVDAYAEHGWTLSRASMGRLDGAAAFLRRLGDVEAGIAPTLFISERCPRLLECLPSLQHSDAQPEDVKKVDCDLDGKGGDDWYDAARYGLMHLDAGRGRAVEAADPGDGWRG